MQAIKSNESFKSVINSDTPVIVKFEAGWCPDCRAMDLWIDPIVEQYNDYQWYTVNRDELEDVVVENEVMGIPSLLVFKTATKLHTFIQQMLSHLNKLNHFSRNF